MDEIEDMIFLSQEHFATRQRESAVHIRYPGFTSPPWGGLPARAWMVWWMGWLLSWLCYRWQVKYYFFLIQYRLHLSFEPENQCCSDKFALLAMKAGSLLFFFSQSEDAKWQRKLSDMLRKLPSRILFALPTFKIGKQSLILIHGILWNHNLSTAQLLLYIRRTLFQTIYLHLSGTSWFLDLQTMYKHKATNRQRQLSRLCQYHAPGTQCSRYYCFDEFPSHDIGSGPQAQRICERFPLTHFLGRHRYVSYFICTSNAWDEHYTAHCVNSTKTIQIKYISSCGFYSEIRDLGHSVDIGYIRLLAKSCADDGRYDVLTYIICKWAINSQAETDFPLPTNEHNYIWLYMHGVYTGTISG